MADEFDPLKQTNNQPSEEFNVKKDRPNTSNDDDLLLEPFENILKLGATPIDRSLEEKPPEETYHKLDFTKNVPKASVRSTNPFDEGVRKPSTPKADIQEQPKEVSTASSEAQWNTTEEYYDQNYQPGPPPAYYPEEYYEKQGSFKRRGFAAAIDRFVHRFPALGIFYKQPQTVPSEQGLGYVEEAYDEAPQLVNANQTARELTADELALNERYSNKQRAQIIQLQSKDQTQPVDVCIHHETYTLYSCDVGRSVVEIFDMYGKLHHVIDDQITSKFQPTAIAVADDGTVIVASHFEHRLHMYLPDNQETESYHFKHYRLGGAGHSVHQFHHPAGIRMDFSDGYLYVCDRGNYRIQVMRPEGICERVIDLVLRDQEQLAVPPIQIAHQQKGDQMVCLVGTGDALCFIPKTADGPIFVEPFYIIDNDGLGLEGASGLAIDSHDRIFISDTGHHRIVICTPEGSYITHIGVEGSGVGELKRPCGLDITNDGTIVVADSGNKRLQLLGSIREEIIEEKSDDKNHLLINPEVSAL